MKWIEIIELRSTGNTRRQLETQLKEFMDLAETETDMQAVKLYTSMMTDTDVSIHLFHQSSEATRAGSSLGVRLVSALKSYGLVSHAVWIEVQKIH